MTLRVDLLRGTEVPQRTEMFHGTEASCVSKLTLGNNVRTRVRERRRAHQTHEFSSCVPAVLPPAHVCAWKAERDRRSIHRAPAHAPALPALMLQHVGYADAAAHGRPWAPPTGRR